MPAAAWKIGVGGAVDHQKLGASEAACISQPRRPAIERRPSECQNYFD